MSPWTRAQLFTRICEGDLQAASWWNTRNENVDNRIHWPPNRSAVWAEGEIFADQKILEPQQKCSVQNTLLEHVSSCEMLTSTSQCTSLKFTVFSNDLRIPVCSVTAFWWLGCRALFNRWFWSWTVHCSASVAVSFAAPNKQRNKPLSRPSQSPDDTGDGSNSVTVVTMVTVVTGDSGNSGDCCKSEQWLPHRYLTNIPLN
jgi:hypothetical protein